MGGVGGGVSGHGGGGAGWGVMGGGGRWGDVVGYSGNPSPPGE